MEKGEQKTVNGILLIDKPVGWTSHDVVSKVRGQLSKAAGKKVKVGHTGTLDPFATGLLILVIGSYTKKAGEFSGMDKTYEAEMVLGSTSETGDVEGRISPESDIRPTKGELEAVFGQFKGKISQMPHKYSAKKINGQKAYDLAREGKEVKLQPNDVTIYELGITNYEYPSVKFTATVSSGTYIRSLAEDIGAKLGTGAYLESLRRTSVGNYRVEDAKQIDKT
jgi:tRNA pseudouridine55 synthase